MSFYLLDKKIQAHGIIKFVHSSFPPPLNTARITVKVFMKFDINILPLKTNPSLHFSSFLPSIISPRFS